jgi:signal transduction histidine kinase
MPRDALRCNMADGKLIRIAATIPIVLVAAGWVLLGQAASPATKDVLVLYSNNRLVPGNVAVDRGLRATLTSATDHPVLVFSEFLDQPEFSGEAYERTMTTYLREKYAARPPDAIVTVSDEALDFVFRHRSQLFPSAPLVHAVASKSLLQAFSTQAADVVGVPIEYDFSGTIEQALRWHPSAQRLVVVTGASERDREREARLRREIPSIAGNITVEYLAGLPTASLQQRLRELDASAVVFTPGYFRDGDGALFNPRDAAALIAAASGAPVYGPFDPFIGTGVVGGRMPSFEDVGRQAGQIVNELLAGAAPTSLHLPDTTPTVLQVDWRQIRRWGIDPKQIPAETLVHFRERTFWEEYRTEAIVAIAVIAFQAALITVLLLEQRRRRAAESAVQKQRTELAHVSRLAVAGELTASIAHEINQPLGAVQTSADAADLILHAGGDRRDDLIRIVTRIRRDNLRASDVIRRLRALLAKHEPERRLLELNAALSDVVTLLRPEALRRQVTLELRSASAPVYVLGDQTQIQQVLINLLLNAMDAVGDMPEDRRTIVLSIKKDVSAISIAVHDFGRGVATDDLPKLFDSFFSTKQRGMGLGLSIARTIVETHGGRIWVENAPGEGAVFHVELPAYDEAGASAPIPT